jgi:hypothetical protein
MTKVRELVRQAAFGITRTPEEIANLEAAINMRPHAAIPGEKVVPNELLQGGSVDEERVRQAMFGYSRNQRGEKIPLSVALDNPQFSEDFRREARAIFAQGASSCSSCCKLDSCNFAR